MPKFGTPDPDAEPEATKPAMDQIPAATKGAAASIPTSFSSGPSFSGPSSSAAVQQLSPEAQLAKIELEKKQWEKESAKQDEHWAKAYWRPAMGWLYMLICLVDFVVFPAISMFIPVITKLPYVAWQSLSLSNGGLIHMAFGAILGVAAYGRTQEKVASKQ
jgi:uncharacterized membrane protein